MPVPESIPITDAQKVTRLVDALTWIADNAHCIQTRRFVAKVLRDFDKMEPDLEGAGRER